MLGKTRHVHFVGVGGIGMSGIAELLANLGYRVSGSDAKRSEVTDRLSSLGVDVRVGHDAANVGEVAVYSVEDKGDVPPRWTIGRGYLKVPRGVAVDQEAKNLIVSDKVGNRIVTFHLPEIF